MPPTRTKVQKPARNSSISPRITRSATKRAESFAVELYPRDPRPPILTRRRTDGGRSMWARAKMEEEAELGEYTGHANFKLGSGEYEFSDVEDGGTVTGKGVGKYERGRGKEGGNGIDGDIFTQVAYQPSKQPDRASNRAQAILPNATFRDTKVRNQPILQTKNQRNWTCLHTLLLLQSLVILLLMSVLVLVFMFIFHNWDYLPIGNKHLYYPKDTRFASGGSNTVFGELDGWDGSGEQEVKELGKEGQGMLAAW